MYRPFTQRCARIDKVLLLLLPRRCSLFFKRLLNVASLKRDESAIWWTNVAVKNGRGSCRIVGRNATRTATFQRFTTTNVFNETRLRF